MGECPSHPQTHSPPRPRWAVNQKSCGVEGIKGRKSRMDVPKRTSRTRRKAVGIENRLIFRQEGKRILKRPNSGGKTKKFGDFCSAKRSKNLQKPLFSPPILGGAGGGSKKVNHPELTLINKNLGPACSVQEPTRINPFQAK